MSEFRDLERRTYRAARDDGLWDVMIASVFSMFAFGPLLSESMGDFWASAVFLPILAGVYVAIHLIRVHVVRPRTGTIELGEERRERMKMVSWVLLALNIVALFLGIFGWFGFFEEWFGISGSVYPVSLAILILAGFSLGAYITGIWRYAAYGLLLAIAGIAGEWMWQNDMADHHGFPVAFGTVAAIILLTGLARLAVVLRDHPLPDSNAAV